MKLAEFIKTTDKCGFDISDEVWDWGTYFEADFEPDEDYKYDNYNNCMIYFAEHIELVKYQEKWYSICKVSDFIKEHYKAFERFVEEENNDNYKPSSYEDYDINGELFYEIFMTTFESLLCGNYTEEDYAKLLRYLNETE